MKKRLITIFAIILALLLIIDLGASAYLYNMVIKRGPKDFLQGNEDLEVSAETMDVFLEGDWIDWTDKQDFEQLEMTSFDGLSLNGYFLEAEKPTNRTVVFAHGYLGRAFDMGLFGEYYYEALGFNMFTPDLRGHGKSEGDYIGFGWHDRLDLIDWINLIIKRKGPETEIVLHGLSMGAAAVLMASGEELPEQVKVIVADSPYSSVYDLFSYQMKRMYHLPDKPILPTLSMLTKFWADYSLTEASAIEQVKKATVPILYITGEADTFVPTEMAKEIYEETNSEKEFYSFPNANHGESIVLYHDKYLKEMTEFIEKYVSFDHN